MQNLYDLLGVRRDADAETIKKAFRNAAKLSHPDHHGGDQQAAAWFTQISQAYEILSDAGQREAYDRQLGAARPAPSREQRQPSRATKRHVSRYLPAAVALATVLTVGYALDDHLPDMRADGVRHPAPDADGAIGRERAAVPLVPRADPPAGAALAADARVPTTIANPGPAGEGGAPSGGDAIAADTGRGMPARPDPVPPREPPSAATEHGTAVAAGPDERPAASQPPMHLLFADFERWRQGSAPRTGAADDRRLFDAFEKWRHGSVPETAAGSDRQLFDAFERWREESVPEGSAYGARQRPARAEAHAKAVSVLGILRGGHGHGDGDDRDRRRHAGANR